MLKKEAALNAAAFNMTGGDSCYDTEEDGGVINLQMWLLGVLIAKDERQG